MLSANETSALLSKAQAGDGDAKNELIQSNSPLVKSVIKRFVGKGIEYDDLYQLGCLGFVKAINNFNESFGVKFSTYVVPMIIGEIKRYMRDDGAVKVSRTIKGQNMKIRRFINAYQDKNGQSPTIEEIANEFSLEPEEIVFIMDSAKMPVSLYAPLEGDGASKNLFLIDRMVQVNDHEKHFDNISLFQALNELEQRDKQIILLRFFRDKTQSDIAKSMGVSQVQISRLENKILDKLKKLINE